MALVLLFSAVFHRDVKDRDAFSWMDPYQYYDFARAVLSGTEHFTEFELPSLFPFLLMPALAIEPSIPAVLWTNVAITVGLVACVHLLCRELEVRTPSALIALLTLSSPLLIGLSRTMYVEYALSVVVALALGLWIRLLRTEDGFGSGMGNRGLAFAIVVGLGFMLKMTFPIFLVLPVGAVLIERLITRRMRDVRVILALTVLPVVGALALQAVFFPRSFVYYLSLGNNTLPIARLIGPPEWASWDSASFYLLEVGRTLLGLLTPFLVLAALTGSRRLKHLSLSELARPRAVLWLWLIGPLLILILPPVKEPRHMAPCVIPALLLAVLAIEEVRGMVWRRALLGMAGLAAVAQISLITTGRMETSYYLTGALRWQAIRQVMGAATGVGLEPGSWNERRLLRWSYQQNVAIDGFPANEALALAWQAFPGVVYDLDSFSEPQRLSDRIPYERASRTSTSLRHSTSTIAAVAGAATTTHSPQGSSWRMRTS